MAQANRDKVPSIISSTLRVVGDLMSDGDVQIDGEVEGDVKAREVTVSENASVKGGIDAEVACIRGMVEGRIAAEKVLVGSTATIRGDVFHSDLSVESGARLEGNCRRLDTLQGEVPPVPDLETTDEDGQGTIAPAAAG